MQEPLRGLVFGSGFAGQGHAEAMRYCGIEVVGMVSRTEEVVKRVAHDMQIPYASTDWFAALEELRPDIVAIGTPGGAHYEQTLAAIEIGCHVFCDKPLTTSAETSKHLHQAATRQRREDCIRRFVPVSAARALGQNVDSGRRDRRAVRDGMHFALTSWTR